MGYCTDSRPFADPIVAVVVERRDLVPTCCPGIAVEKVAVEADSSDRAGSTAAEMGSAVMDNNSELEVASSSLGADVADMPGTGPSGPFESMLWLRTLIVACLTVKRKGR